MSKTTSLKCLGSCLLVVYDPVSRISNTMPPGCLKPCLMVVQDPFLLNVQDLVSRLSRTLPPGCQRPCLLNVQDTVSWMSMTLFGGCCWPYFQDVQLDLVFSMSMTLYPGSWLLKIVQQTLTWCDKRKDTKSRFTFVLLMQEKTQQPVCLIRSMVALHASATAPYPALTSNCSPD